MISLLHVTIILLMTIAEISAWSDIFLHRSSVKNHMYQQLAKPLVNQHYQLYSSQNQYQREESPSLDTRTRLKTDLDDLLKCIPVNKPTGPKQTAQILSLVRELENYCPTPQDQVLTNLVGNWELIWTSVDPNSMERQTISLQNWINPIENQSYGNNPDGDPQILGRSNPILPRSIQDQLEDWGLLKSDVTSTIRSSQSIDLKKGKVRNVVSFQSQNPLANGAKIRGSIIVDIDCIPSRTRKRRVDVKFTACRILVQNSPLDIRIPLGLFGPSGWLETGYIDETMRITRGHKGSVFILYRI